MGSTLRHLYDANGLPDQLTIMAYCFVMLLLFVTRR